jgi:hypothetical protein
VQLAVEQDLTATIATLTYVTPWKIFGGTYAFGVAPSMLAADVNVGIGLPAFTGPRGRTFGPFNFETGDTNLAPGDLGIIPLLLGWNAGNVHWNFALFGLAPTGDYSIRQLANMSLNHWSIMPRVAATYFDPKSGWQLNGSPDLRCELREPGDGLRVRRHSQFGGKHNEEFRPLGCGRERLCHDPDHWR